MSDTYRTSGQLPLDELGAAPYANQPPPPAGYGQQQYHQHPPTAYGQPVRPQEQRAPEPPRRDRDRMGWVVKGLGLLAVAVVSGFVWWFFANDSPDDSPSTSSQGPGVQKPASEFTYTPLREPVTDSNCADHAYGKIKQFLVGTPCSQLMRSLYSLQDSGKQVLVSVVVVRMPDVETATSLKALTDEDKTGNVYDLAREGTVKVPGGPEWVAHGGYSSGHSGRDVVIVEADYYGAKKGDQRDEARLDRISKDAVRLGPEVAR